MSQDRMGYDRVDQDRVDQDRIGQDREDGVKPASIHPPWVSSRVIFQNQEEYAYRALKIRLVEVATRSRHRCQRLYVDFVSTQYWLGVTTTSRHGGFGYEVLKPVSADTADALIAGE